GTDRAVAHASHFRKAIAGERDPVSDAGPILNHRSGPSSQLLGPIAGFLACVENAQRLRLPSAPLPGRWVDLVPDPVREKPKIFREKIAKDFSLRDKRVLTVKKKPIVIPVTHIQKGIPMLDQAADTSTPNTENFTVKRRYLTQREVEQLIEAAKSNRHGHRDATMILVAYRHGMRASEVCSLEWHQIELDLGRLHVRRAKRGTPSVHPIRGDEIRALRK